MDDVDCGVAKSSHASVASLQENFWLHHCIIAQPWPK